MNSSTFNILSHAKRIVVPGIAAVALMAPAAAWAMPAGRGAGERRPTPRRLSRISRPPTRPMWDGPRLALPDLPPASPTDVGRPAVPITVLPITPPGLSFSSEGTFQSPAPSTLPDLAPANPTQVTPEELPARTTLPDLPPASPTLAAPVGQPAVNDGFDFGDAGIGVAVVAGACALLLALAAFFVGRRRHAWAPPTPRRPAAEAGRQARLRPPPGTPPCPDRHIVVPSLR